MNTQFEPYVAKRGPHDKNHVGIKQSFWMRHEFKHHHFGGVLICLRIPGFEPDQRVRQGVDLTNAMLSNRYDCPAGIKNTEGILLDAPELIKNVAACGIFC